MFEFFFLRICFAFENMIFYWCDILHCLLYFTVLLFYVCVLFFCLCCLELLNTSCFTIVRLELLLADRTILFPSLFSALHGQIFIPHKCLLSMYQISCLCSSFLGAKPVKNKYKSLSEICVNCFLSSCFWGSSFSYLWNYSGKKKKTFHFSFSKNQRIVVTSI